MLCCVVLCYIICCCVIPLLSSFLLHPATLHIVPYKNIFFLSPSLSSRTPPHFCFHSWFLHSCYLTLCLHFSSSLLFLIRLLLSCSLSPGLACMVVKQANVFVSVCVGASLCVCLCVCVCVLSQMSKHCGCLSPSVTCHRIQSLNSDLSGDTLIGECGHA